MDPEIVARLGLDEARFDQGLDRATSRYRRFGQEIQRQGVRVFNPSGTDARESAKVFQDIYRAQEEFMSKSNFDRINSALSAGPGAIGGAGKSAAASASVFEESFQAQDSATQAQQRGLAEAAEAEAALAAAKRRHAYEEANTVGRIKMVQQELVGLAKERDKTARGTTERLRTELQIEERKARLRGLQRSQQAQNISVLPPIAAVERQAGGIIAMLRRKFSTADVFKDALKSFGAAGAGGVVGSITSYFSRQADRAQGVEQLLGGKADNLKNTLATLGGMSVRLQLNARDVKNLNAQINNTRNALADLEGNPLNLIHPLWQGQVDKLNTELNGLLGQQDALQQENTVLSREIEYQNQLYEAQVNQIETLNWARSRGYSELRLAQNELIAAQERLFIAQTNKRPKEEIRALTLEVKRQEGAVQQLTRAMRAHRATVVTDLTQQAANSGRTFRNGQPRPRTETERLADRAVQSRRTASDAILTAQPELARSATLSAQRDEGTVVSRLSQASRLMPDPKTATDFTQLKVELVSANKLLTSIDTSLKVTAVK